MTITVHTRAELESKSRDEILALVNEANFWTASLPPERYSTPRLIDRLLAHFAKQVADEAEVPVRKAASYHIGVSQEGDSTVVFVLDGVIYTRRETDEDYERVVAALLADEDPLAAIEEAAPPSLDEAVAPLETLADVEVAEDDEQTLVKINGQEIDGALVKTLLRYADEGRDPENTLRFLDLLGENPSERARNELFEWTKRQDLHLAEDGRFLGFKSFIANADGSYRPHYDGRVWVQKPGQDEPVEVRGSDVRIEVGDKVSMPREICDPDAHKDCSVGLHVGSWGYARTYAGGQNVLEVAVNPADVVSVPSHDTNKLRTCLYEVIAIHTPGARVGDTVVEEGSLGHQEPERTRWPEPEPDATDSVLAKGVPAGFWNKLKAKLGRSRFEEGEV